MSRGKPKSQTRHGRIRLAERLHITGKHAIRNFAYNASTNGVSWANMKDSPLKDYVRSKSKRHRVKLYHNHIVVMFKNSNRIITVYDIPKELEQYLV